MATKLDIQNAIIQAYGYAIELGNELYTEHSKGCVDCYDASNIECLIWLTGELQYRVDNDFLDADTDKLYAQLLEALSGYVGFVTVDTNASIPYTIINVEGGGGIVSWEDILGDPANSASLVAYLPIAFQNYLQTQPDYNTLTELYDYINEQLNDGVPESQILGQFYWGNGDFQKITQEDIDNAQGGIQPNPPTNGIVDDINKTFTFTESI